MSFEELRVAARGQPAAPVPPKTAPRLPFGVLRENAAEPMVLTTTTPRRLVFSTAKRDVPKTLRRAERDDLTINSAIALREMDSLFLASPKRAAAPSPGPAFEPRAIFRDEA